ncbi:MAG: hypothetical protein ACK4ME_02155 [Fimbriimonadales bacterium]
MRRIAKYHHAMNDAGYPRRAIVLLSGVRTLLTGALATPRVLNGVMVYSNPAACGERACKA